jgi:hypothetical protein
MKDRADKWKQEARISQKENHVRGEQGGVCLWVHGRRLDQSQTEGNDEASTHIAVPRLVQPNHTAPRFGSCRAQHTPCERHLVFFGRFKWEDVARQTKAEDSNKQTNKHKKVSFALVDLDVC